MLYRLIADDFEMNAEASTRTDTFSSEEYEDDGPIFVPLEHKIYYNNLIMTLIIGYIGSFKVC